MKDKAIQIFDEINHINFLKYNLDAIISWINYLNDRDKKILIDQFLIGLKKESESIIGFKITPIFCNASDIFEAQN